MTDDQGFLRRGEAAASEGDTGHDTRQTPAVIWFLAVNDLAAGAYPLVDAQRRERRDKPECWRSG